MRRALQAIGITLGICLLLILGWIGVGWWKARAEESRDRATLDMVLTTGQIDKVEVVNDDADRKIVLAGEEAKAVLAKFAATNRVPWSGPMFLKLFFAGNISFDATTGPRGWGIGYIPHHDAASYGQYYFRLKGTNDLRSVFEWWRTNDVRGTH